MSDAPANGRASMGVQAYRWLVLIGIAALGLLSARTLAQIDKTSEKVETIQGDVANIKGALEAEKLTRENRIEVTRGALDSKMDRADNALSDRINAHEHRLTAVEQRTKVQDQQMEEFRRKLWERKP